MDARHQSWRLAWPLILSNLSVPLLGMVDTAVVGHLDDPAPLAAVALGATLISVLYFLFGFLRTGTTALAAQALGAGDGVEVRASLVRALLTAAALGAALLVASPALRLVGGWLLAPSPPVAPGFAGYVTIRLLGAPAALATMALLGWFLGLQDARRPLAVMVATNALNAVLDIILVLGLGMAAEGVALATVVAEHAGLALALALARPFWRRVAAARLSRAQLLDRSRFLRLWRINRDLFLRSTLLEAAFLGFAAIGSRLGDVTLAANAVLMNLFTLTAYGLDGFAHAAEALVGRAIGARDLQGFRAAVRASFANALVLAVLLTLLFALTAMPLVRILTGLEAVRATASSFVGYAVALPAVAVWAFVWDGVFFGAARASDLRNGMALACALLALLAALLVPPFGNHGLWTAFLAFLAARGLILWWLYRLRGAGAGFVVVPG